MIRAGVHGDCMHAFRPSDHVWKYMGRMKMHGIACTSSTLKREESEWKIWSSSRLGQVC